MHTLYNTLRWSCHWPNVLKRHWLILGLGRYPWALADPPPPPHFCLQTNSFLIPRGSILWLWDNILWRIRGGGGGVRALPPPSNFVCMQFSAKHLPNNGLAHPSGNPGSATDIQPLVSIAERRTNRSICKGRIAWRGLKTVQILSFIQTCVSRRQSDTHALGREDEFRVKCFLLVFEVNSRWQ